MTPPTGKPLSESERQEFLRHTSPEFQAAIKTEQEQELAQQAAQWKRQTEGAEAEERKIKVINALFTAGMWILILGTLLAVIYALTKFIKWAWYS